MASSCCSANVACCLYILGTYLKAVLPLTTKTAATHLDLRLSFWDSSYTRKVVSGCYLSNINALKISNNNAAIRNRHQIYHNVNKRTHWFKE